MNSCTEAHGFCAAWRWDELILKFRILALLLVSVLLFGCARNPILRSGSSVAPINGVLFMTLGYQKLYPPFQTYGIGVRAIGSKSDKKSYFFAYPFGGMFGASEDAIKIPDGLAMLSALELSPGEYELYEYWAITDTGPIAWQFKYRSTVPVHIQVHAGEVVYLGSAILETIPHENRKYQYVVSDEFARDRLALENFKPELRAWSVRKRLVGENPIGPLTRY
jgi:hypothetical protein